MSLAELSPGAVVYAFGDRAVEEARMTWRHWSPQAWGVEPGVDWEKASSERTHVPSGARMLTPGLGTLLVTLTFWSLREQAAIALEPVEGALDPGLTHPYTKGRIRAKHVAAKSMSQTRARVLDAGERPGMEGCLLAGAAWRPMVRSAISAARFPHYSDPWAGVIRRFRGEAVDAGAVTLSGMPGLRRPHLVARHADALRARYDALMHGFLAFADAEPDLSARLREDCLVGISTHIATETTSS